MRFDSHSFTVFKAVIEQQSFAKAAASLNLAQSAVSYQIKQLEHQLNLTLFDRSQYRARLTAEGQSVWREAQNLFAVMQNLKDISQRTAAGWESKLDIVVEGALPQQAILQAVKQLMQQNIPTRIRLRTEFLGGVQEQFEQANADMMLTLHHHNSPKFTAHPLQILSLVLVCHPDYPLARRHSVDDEQLQQHTELVVQDTSQRLKMDKGLAPVSGDSVIFLSDFQTKKKALIMGLGYGWIPKQFVETELKSKQLRLIQHNRIKALDLQPQLVYHSEIKLGKAGKRFRNLILENYPGNTRNE